MFQIQGTLKGKQLKDKQKGQLKERRLSGKIHQKKYSYLQNWQQF